MLASFVKAQKSKFNAGLRACSTFTVQSIKLRTFESIAIAHTVLYTVYSTNLTTFTYDRLWQKQFLFMKERYSCYSFFKFDEKE